MKFFQKVFLAALTAFALMSSSFAENLVTNPGFESGTTGWAVWQNTSAVTSGVIAGAASIRTGIGAGGASQTLSVLPVPGATYTLSAVGRISVAGDGAALFIDCLNSSGTAILTKSVTISSTSNQTLVTTIQAPAGTAKLSVWIWKDAGAGHLFLDNISVEPPAALPSPVPSMAPLPPTPPTSSVIVAVNAGGPSFLASNGISYSADMYFSGGSKFSASALPIENTTDDVLFQTERFGKNVAYNVPLANGSYELTLRFSEIYWNASGKRIFDLLVEGVEVVANLDIFARVGRGRVLDIVHTVTVSDGKLSILARTDVDQAKISAFHIKRISPAPSPVPSPKPSPVPSPVPSPAPVTGIPYYVSPTGNDANPGTSVNAPLRTIASASSKAVAGDTVFLLPGNYSESIVPTKSGLVAKPITYKSYGPAPAIITSPSSNGNFCGTGQTTGIAIKVSGRSYIVIDGIHVNGGAYVPNARFNNFVCLANSSNIIIRNGNFKYANGWAGVDFHGSHYVTIEDSLFDFMGGQSFAASPNDGVTGDNICMDYGPVSTHNLIQRNKFYHPGHNHVSIMTGTDNIIQDNYFNGSWRDVVGGNTGYRSMHVFGQNNVVQRNHFEFSGINTTIAGFRVTHPPIMNVGGIGNIIRNNVIARADGDAIITEYGSWVPNVQRLRIYNNTIYRANAMPWSLQYYGGGNAFGDLVLKNNFLVDSRLAPPNGAVDNDLAFDFFNSGGPGALGDTGTTQAVNNFIAPGLGKAPAMYFYPSGQKLSISAAETRYPAFLSRNVSARPVFNVSTPVVVTDFRLKAGSPGIDQAAFLTTIVGSGTSNRIKVADVYYFSEGKQMVPGDQIQLQGSSQSLTILSIDRATSTLTLSGSVSFTDGQGIGLAYSGSAPDVGAFESAPE